MSINHTSVPGAGGARDPNNMRAALGKNAMGLAVWATLLLMVLFGWLRYDNFLGAYNIFSFFQYNAIFAAISLGMCFVIVTGGIDLSVGGAAALASVLAAMASPYGVMPGIIVGVGAGMCVGVLNAYCVVQMRIAPFIATLATALASTGTALLISNNQSVGVSYETLFIEFGQGDWFGMPIPAVLVGVLFVGGWLVLSRLPLGRRILAVGGGEDASRLMGVRTDRIIFGVYIFSGVMAGLAGAILAAQFGAGQPTEGTGWELFAIAAVVVGGTLLTGGEGSVVATLGGVLLLGLLFNMLNFENGKGWISLSAYWQSVIRGGFLLVFIVVQAKIAQGREAAKHL
ncbi:ABC transporter permease [Phaeobacter sp. J2-8]|uniref:ABC transporter permease n=1 Tax=Phaeobacter sp. J2-8 TaxID=2931394 RepID=UPI001FD3D77A|nr:ABC transporter permease [Phaeobacter sp. J2-8]MCJ7872743.1 ABC transporter permease [Phaeobacter sp. J2-8]